MTDKPEVKAPTKKQPKKVAEVKQKPIAPKSPKPPVRLAWVRFAMSVCLDNRESTSASNKDFIITLIGPIIKFVSRKTEEAIYTSINNGRCWKTLDGE